MFSLNVLIVVYGYIMSSILRMGVHEILWVCSLNCAVFISKLGSCQRSLISSMDLSQCLMKVFDPTGSWLVILIILNLYPAAAAQVFSENWPFWYASISLIL